MASLSSLCIIGKCISSSEHSFRTHLLTKKLICIFQSQFILNNGRLQKNIPFQYRMYSSKKSILVSRTNNKHSTENSTKEAFPLPESSTFNEIESLFESAAQSQTSHSDETQSSTIVTQKLQQDDPNYQFNEQNAPNLYSIFNRKLKRMEYTHQPKEQLSDEEKYTTIHEEIANLIRLNEHHRVDAIFQEMIHSPLLPTERTVYLVLKSILNGEPNMQILKLNTLRHHANTLNLPLSIASYNLMLNIYAQSSLEPEEKSQYMQHVLSELQEHDLQPNTLTCNALLRGAFDETELLSIWESMISSEDDSISPNMETYIIMMQFFSHQVERMRMFYRHMVYNKKGSPNELVYRLLIDSHARIGDVMAVSHYLKEMNKNLPYVDMDDRILYSIVTSFAVSKQTDKILGVYQKFQPKSNLFTPVSWIAFLDAFVMDPLPSLNILKLDDVDSETSNPYYESISVQVPAIYLYLRKTVRSSSLFSDIPLLSKTFRFLAKYNAVPQLTDLLQGLLIYRSKSPLELTPRASLSGVHFAPIIDSLLSQRKLTVALAIMRHFPESWSCSNCEECIIALLESEMLVFYPSLQSNAQETLELLQANKQETETLGDIIESSRQTTKTKDQSLDVSTININNNLITLLVKQKRHRKRRDFLTQHQMLTPYQRERWQELIEELESTLQPEGFLNELLKEASKVERHK